MSARIARFERPVVKFDWSNDGDEGWFGSSGGYRMVLDALIRWITVLVKMCW